MTRDAESYDEEGVLLLLLTAASPARRPVNSAIILDPSPLSPFLQSGPTTAKQDSRTRRPATTRRTNCSVDITGGEEL